jgi:ABC-2 type transport system ATP-binding protein
MAIEAVGLTKRYGDKVAVNDLSFTVRPGIVTGFLGPNGAGKSTTMRMLLGLDRPTKGHALIGGQAYRDLQQPLSKVGALLEARAMHPGRSAHNHLLYLAQTQGLPAAAVDRVIDMVGLRAVARKRVGKFSLGMGQRVGIAAALLGDPNVIVLDEPVNGLDPEGVHWIRNLMRDLAAQGRTVLVSSHLMNEMALTADHLIVIGQGQLLADCSMREFIARNSEDSVSVKTPHVQQLRDALEIDGAAVEVTHDRMLVTKSEPARIGEIAARNGVVLHELAPLNASLEDAFLHMTQDSVEYREGAMQ